MVRELKRWRLACPTNGLDLVFPNEAGGPMNYSNMVQRYFFPALKVADLTRVRFHDLRHTSASLRLEIGENIKYIQTQLGHANPTVTLNVYAHLMNATNQEGCLPAGKCGFWSSWAPFGHQIRKRGYGLSP
jgi:integrase